MLQEHEVDLGPISRIPTGEGREFVVEGRRIAVFRLRSGEVRATQADCPHRQGPLVDGLVGGSVVACPLHGWKFDLSTGLPVLGECGLTVYPARLSTTGNILLSLPTDNGEAAPPREMPVCAAFS